MDEEIETIGNLLKVTDLISLCAINMSELVSNSGDSLLMEFRTGLFKPWYKKNTADVSNEVNELGKNGFR